MSLSALQPTNIEQDLPAKRFVPSWSQHTRELPDSHPATAQILLSHARSSLQGTEILSDASTLNGSLYTTSSSETSPSSVETTKTDDEEFVPSKGDAYSKTYKQIWLPVYGPSITSQHLWRHFVTEKSGKIAEMLPGLATIADSLSQAQRSADAFDIFYLITYGLNDAIVQDQSLGPLLPFFAIKCVRSTCSQGQLAAAKILREQLRIWHDECYPFGWNQSPKTALHIRELFTMSELLYKEDEGWTFPQYHFFDSFQYPANGVLLDFTNSNDDFSAWLHAREFWPKDLCAWHRDVLNTFFESRWIQQAMFEALREIQACIQHSSAYIDDALGKYWPPDRGNCEAMTQVLVSSVMEHHVAASARPEGVVNSQSTDSECPRWFTRFKELAIISLPFLMMHWVYEPEIFQHNGELFRKHGSGCSDTLQLATLRLHQDLDLEPGTTSYKDFMIVYLCEMNARRPSTTSFDIVPSDRIVRLAASMAGVVLTSPDANPFITPSEASPDVNPFITPAGTSNPSSNPLHPNFAPSPGHLDSLATDIWRISLSDESPNPPAARSYTSSISSGYKSFKGRSVLHRLLGSSSRRSNHSASSSKISDPMSWKQENTSDIFSTRGGSSNASMGGLDEYAAGLGALAAMRQDGSMLQEAASQTTA